MTQTMFILTSEPRESAGMILCQQPLCCVFPSLNYIFENFIVQSTVCQLGIQASTMLVTAGNHRCKAIVYYVTTRRPVAERGWVTDTRVQSKQVM